MLMLGRVVLFLTAAILAAPVSAQLGDVLVGTQWVFDTDAAHPGGTVQAALQVRLDQQYHVNSNKPDEDFLIPTVLTVTPPEGFTVSKIVYPEPIMLKPAFSEVPMSVFEREFVYGHSLKLDKAEDSLL